MSKALSPTGTGNLQHGRRSQFLKQFGSCEVCPVRDYCDIKPLLNNIQQERGCDDIRNIFFENLKKWKKPISVLIRNAAEVETKLAMQQLKDGKDKQVASDKWMKLKELELKIASQIMKYDPNATQQRITVEHKFGPECDDVIPMNPNAYESDTLPDKEPDVHPNLGADKLEKYKDQVKK